VTRILIYAAMGALLAGVAFVPFGWLVTVGSPTALPALINRALFAFFGLAG